MNWFELLYVCMKPPKVHEPDTKRENIDNVNVLINNERLTDMSNYSNNNYSESCSSIMSELSTIDED